MDIVGGTEWRRSEGRSRGIAELKGDMLEDIRGYVRLEQCDGKDKESRQKGREQTRLRVVRFNDINLLQ